jgi:60 kDa SS-A/Ro ribonucleoprotein
VKSPEILATIFDRVIDSPKMLRNFVQIIRSGAAGRKSLGTLPKRLILQWLEGRTDDQLFTGSVGNAPSLADVIKMVHPKPASASRAALYGYLIGRDYDRAALPGLVQQYEKFKRNTNLGAVMIPDVPFQLLTSLPLTAKDWRQIARNGSWQMTRMNLNTFVRHEVFQNPELIGVVANRLRNPRLIESAGAFPYQLLAAYLNVSEEIPGPIRESLQDALEIAINNVPHINGKVYVFPDISGSMHSPLTGDRGGSTTKVRCVDVAALVAAAIVSSPAMAGRSKADQRDQEIQDLKARLEKLEKDNAAAQQAADDDRISTGSRLAKVEATQDAVQWTFNDGRPLVRSGDGRFELAIRGMFQGEAGA